MPDVLTGVRVQRNNGAEKQVVAAFRAANLSVPWRAIACTYIELVQLLVIGKGMPGITAATVLPPFARPGFGRHFHGCVFETICRVTRHDVELPRFFTGVGIVGSYPASGGAVLGTTVADKYLALESLWSAGNVQGAFHIKGAHRPDFATALRIQRKQPAIPGGGKELPFIK